MSIPENARRDQPPPWCDLEMTAWLFNRSEDTIRAWAAQGIIPPGRKRGGSLWWKWSELDERFTLGEVGGTPDAEAEAVRAGIRGELATVHARPY